MRTDDLELAWDDEMERGRHRHRRRRLTGDGGEGGGRGGRTAIALLVTLAILGVLAGGVWYGFDKVSDFFAAPDYTSGGTTEKVMVKVKQDQTAADIGKDLQAVGVVKSQKAFVNAAKDNPRSKQIQPGSYELRKKMRAVDALKVLIDRKNRVVSTVTLPEGLSLNVTLAKLAEATKLPLDDFKQAVANPAALGLPDWWFNRSDKKQAIKGPEGFVSPGTYEFDPGVTAPQVVKHIIDQFLKTAEGINLVKTAESKNITPFAALITASLVQAETGTVQDMGKVARVIYNRLDKNMALEFDSTTNYWRDQQGLERKLSLSDAEQLDPNNPYRTYGVAGLPPGPIGNPGKDALQAALNPTPGNWLFFVRIDKAGNSRFTNSFAEHQRNIEEARRNGAYD